MPLTFARKLTMNMNNSSFSHMKHKQSYMRRDKKDKHVA